MEYCRKKHSVGPSQTSATFQWPWLSSFSSRGYQRDQEGHCSWRPSWEVLRRLLRYATEQVELLRLQRRDRAAHRRHDQHVVSWLSVETGRAIGHMEVVQRLEDLWPAIPMRNEEEHAGTIGVQDSISIGWNTVERDSGMDKWHRVGANNAEVAFED